MRTLLLVATLLLPAGLIAGESPDPGTPAATAPADGHGAPAAACACGGNQAGGPHCCAAAETAATPNAPAPAAGSEKSCGCGRKHSGS